MEKIYCCNQYESKDEKLIPRVQISNYMYNISKEYPKDEHLKNDWKIYYKNIANDVRKSWNIEGIISLVYSQERESVIVSEFPIKANNTIFSPEIIWDEIVQKYYYEA